MSDNWYVILLSPKGNTVMTADDNYSEAASNYRHFMRMYPDNSYRLIHENELSKYFEMVR